MPFPRIRSRIPTDSKICLNSPRKPQSQYLCIIIIKKREPQPITGNLGSRSHWHCHCHRPGRSRRRSPKSIRIVTMFLNWQWRFSSIFCFVWPLSPSVPLYSLSFHFSVLCIFSFFFLVFFLGWLALKATHVNIMQRNMLPIGPHGKPSSSGATVPPAF